MQEVLEMIKHILRSDVDFVVDKQRLRPQTSEVFRLWGDNSLIRQLTDFEPKYTLQNGLLETCTWFSESSRLNQYKSAIYNV